MGGCLVKCLLDILFKQNFVPSKADVTPRTTATTLAMLEINGCLIPKASRTCGSSTIRNVNTMEPMTEKIRGKVRRHAEDAVSQGTYVECYYKLAEDHEEEYFGSSPFDIRRVEEHIEEDKPNMRSKSPMKVRTFFEKKLSVGSRGGSFIASGSIGETPSARAGRPSVTKLIWRIVGDRSGRYAGPLTTTTPPRTRTLKGIG